MPHSIKADGKREGFLGEVQWLNVIGHLLMNSVIHLAKKIPVPAIGYLKSTKPVGAGEDKWPDTLNNLKFTIGAMGSEGSNFVFYVVYSLRR